MLFWVLNSIADIIGCTRWEVSAIVDVSTLLVFNVVVLFAMHNVCYDWNLSYVYMCSLVCALLILCRWFLSTVFIREWNKLHTDWQNRYHFQEHCNVTLWLGTAECMLAWMFWWMVEQKSPTILLRLFSLLEWQNPSWSGWSGGWYNTEYPVFLLRSFLISAHH